jgi:hypothetical protein
MWRGLPMRPMPWLPTKTGYPMHRSTAIGAMKHQPTELALEVGLHVQELEAEYFCLKCRGMRPVETGAVCLVQDGASRRGLITDGPHGSLKDVSPARHRSHYGASMTAASPSGSGIGRRHLWWGHEASPCRGGVE